MIYDPWLYRGYAITHPEKYHAELNWSIQCTTNRSLNRGERMGNSFAFSDSSIGSSYRHNVSGMRGGEKEDDEKAVPTCAIQKATRALSVGICPTEFNLWTTRADDPVLKLWMKARQVAKSSSVEGSVG